MFRGPGTDPITGIHYTIQCSPSGLVRLVSGLVGGSRFCFAFKDFRVIIV